jgi:hypothetical protein
MEPKFATKTGYCHILPDKIVLTRYGTPGNVAGATSGNRSVFPTLAGYTALAGVLSYLAYTSVRNENLKEAVLLTLLFILFCYNVITSLDHSTTPVIERAAIRNMRFIKGIPYLTRSRFEISFEDHSGKLKKRLLILPGMLNNGPQHTESALTILRSEGLIVS